MADLNAGVFTDVRVEVGSNSVILKQRLDESQLAPIFDDEWTASMVCSPN